MELTFSSIEEVKEFVKQLKGTRGPKDKDDEPAAQTLAPLPLQPPAAGHAGFPGSAGFAPPVAGAGQAAAGPFAAAAPVVAPEVLALVNRIVVRADGAVASGQSVDSMVTWFRGQCGPEAAQATMDQIKQVFLPKLSLPALENIAKLMAA
jgi:hypothetical protein